MGTRSERARVPLAGVAVAGIVAGHALTYLVAVRQPAHREAILVETGHSYWSSAVSVALVLGVVALMAIGLRVVRGVRERHDPPFALAAPILGAVQVLAYVAIEIVERLLSRVPIAELVDHHDLLPIGIALQLGVAVFGALTLRLLARTLRLVADVLRPPRRRYHVGAAWAGRRAMVSLRSRALRCAWGLRGPPRACSPTVAG